MVSTKTKAKSAARAQTQGNFKSNRKVHTKVQWKTKPTKKQARKPLYPRQSAPGKARINDYSVLKFPLTTEVAMKAVEDHRTLVFIVDIRATKPQIKNAMNKVYQVKAAKVNTLIRPDGQKKAFIRLAPEHDALDIASKIGMF
ncbi:ribosomal protein L23a [Thecamonas trahens ATCC 50062]|uniref:Ribosomal protein L23a n=1 Tax=Thecamonas trahens ATCC 50062 TaxID=461836 RepID=A0A0L0D4I1_THETB|nr:ribosomal protein L23a [Thecamonas trahens ATCC 50062]KNC47140.1 ribosomal protein L23a [Thecamonas trahens ATCC 50062]|eukprot:XP_013759916.1 ribosomal protein L23a [Thecamonas trahens ATCC 50062]